MLRLQLLRFLSYLGIINKRRNLPLPLQPCDKYNNVNFFNVTTTFAILWNSRHKIKSQNNLELPNDVPTHIFYFPEKYGGTQNDIQVTNESSQEALREKCPNTEFFLVRIFPHSDRIRSDTEYGPKKTLYLDTFHARSIH